jgi:uroporphyrinogen decarboxylase
MADLTHRERALKALNHQETDRVPIDMGGLSQTNINVIPYVGLVKLLKLEKEAGATLYDDGATSRGMAVPSEAVLKALDLDFRGVSPSAPPFNYRDQDNYVDEWGVQWVRTRGSPFIAKTGPFEAREPSIADLEKFRWPDPDNPARVKGLRAKAEKLRKETDCAIVLNLPYCVVREHQRLRGFTEGLADLLANPNLSHYIMVRATEISSRIAVNALKVGDLVDVVSFAEDMGIQEQPFMRPELYRKMVKQYHRRFVESIKRSTKAKVAIHSDGAIYDLLRDFIEIGIEVLNPVQLSAKGMGDTKKLKAEFGRDLCFWGAIDTHRVLPFGKPADVVAEVKRRIGDLAPAGGYVLGSVHTINQEVPPANVAAMLETARTFRLRK